MVFRTDVRCKRFGQEIRGSRSAGREALQAKQVERQAVAYAHGWFEGRSVDWTDMTCTTFVLQGSSFNDTCWAEGHEYDVSTTYASGGELATAYVRNSGGLEKASNWIKNGDGSWTNFSWQF